MKGVDWQKIGLHKVKNLIRLHILNLKQLYFARISSSAPKN